MSWEAISAVASLASAAIVFVAAIAALIQLRHVRLANQLQSYTQFMAALQSPELTEARRYVQSLDVSDPAVIAAATTPEVDRRITAVGVHFQSVSRLLNQGVLDERLFAPYFDTTPRVWRTLEPIAAVIRERVGSPMWVDIEYLVYRAEKGRLLHKHLSAYPRAFLKAKNLDRFIDALIPRIDR
jgi:hypothetical protein